MLKHIKLLVEAVLLFSFVGFFVVMFVGPGRWMGILAGSVFILLPTNLFLEKQLRHKRAKIHLGGVFIFLFMMVFGVFALYMSLTVR